MYGFIGSSEYFKEVRSFVFSQDDEVGYKIIGEDIDILSEINNVTQVKVKHLIIDIASLLDEAKIVQAIESYKRVQPTTQVIVIVSLKYIPGNLIISEIIKLGVYDIIRHEIEQGSLEDILLDHIVHPSPLRRVKEWQVAEGKIDEIKSNEEKEYVEDSTDEEEYFEEDIEQDYEEEYSEEDIEEEYEEERKFFIQPKKIVERTITIIQEKIVGTGVIAIAGTTNRIGTTHTSVLMANFLSSKEFKVGVVELHPSKHFEVIKNAYDGLEESKSYFKLQNTYFYPYKKELNITSILQEDFNYLILDMGEYEICNLEEFHRANKKILVSGVKEWEIPLLEKIVLNKEENTYISKYLYAFNFSDDDTFQFVKNNMNHMACFKLEFNPSLFEVSKEAAAAFSDMLQDILPMQNKKGNKSIFGFLKREG